MRLGFLLLYEASIWVGCVSTEVGEGWLLEGAKYLGSASSILKAILEKAEVKRETKSSAWVRRATAMVMLFVSIVCICSVKAGVHGVSSLELQETNQ